MVTLPADTPYTVSDATVATVVGALLHTPPVTGSARVVVDPSHTAPAPVIVPACGSGFTVTAIEAYALPQTLLTVYEISVVPALAPPTVPPDTVAINGSRLLHVPPGAGSVKTIVDVSHTVVVGPLITPATGWGFTVKGNVAADVPQVFVTVYEMVVAPPATPVTMPPLVIVAALVLVLDQVPLPAASARDVVSPSHTLDAPVIEPAFGSGFTVMGCVAYADPQLKVETV